MKTLVIHPKDQSTDMLSAIYKGRDFTVIRDTSLHKTTLMTLISQHDRIIMMGHGSPFGLFNPELGGFLIDDSFAPLLKSKETISIWCNSDEYFKRFGMGGFHTGMIISEVGEAQWVLGETPLNEKETLENMKLFSRVIGECIDMPPHQMRDYILKHYDAPDRVTQFNRKNLFVL